MGNLNRSSKATAAALLVGAGVVAGALIFSGSGHSQPAEQIVIRQAAATSAVTTPAPRTVKPARPAGTPAVAAISASRVSTPKRVQAPVTVVKTAAPKLVVYPQEAPVTTDPTTPDPQPDESASPIQPQPTPTDTQPLPSPPPSSPAPVAVADAPPPIRPHGSESPTCDSWNSVEGHANHC